MARWAIGGIRVVLVLCLFAAGAVAGAQDPRLAQARELLSQGLAGQAVTLLEPLEIELAQNREYNGLFAQALLDAGQPARALFPINRLTRGNPDDPAALLLLTRARMALGQAQPAREALERAQKLKQAPETAQRLDQLLSVIAAAEEAGTTRFGGSLEVSYGYDSNVNSATGATQIALPVFGGAIGTLNRAATKQDDSFLAVGGSVGLKYPITGNLALVASGSASQRLNSTDDEFDTRTIDGSVGLRYTLGANEWTGVFTAQQFEVDYQRFRVTTGGSLQYRRQLGPRSEVSAFAQLARLDYPSQSLRNTDRRVIGLALGHAFPGQRPPILFGSVFAGEEDERESNVEFFGHRLRGFRVGIDKAFSDRFAASASFGYERRRYGGQDPLFLVSREDEQKDFRLSLPYALSPRWLLIPQLSYTDNRSNVDLNRYRRTAVFMVLRWLF